MDFKDIAAAVGKIAPMLGTLLGGPAAVALNVGGMIASALGCENSPSDVALAMRTNPDAAVKIAEIESTERVRLQEMVTSISIAEINAESQANSNTNQTMQVEAGSEHWITYGWRGTLGVSIAVCVIELVTIVGLAYVGVIFWGKDPKCLEYIPAMIAAMIGVIGVVSPILGIASYFRGKAQADPAIPAAIQLPLR